MSKNHSTMHPMSSLAMSRRCAITGFGCALAGAALGGAGSAWADGAMETSSDEVSIAFSDNGIKVDGEDISLDEGERVYLAHDVVYYEDRDEYDSGNPYGEGTDEERHSAEDAAAVSVVHITQAGTYRLTGSTSAGQVWVDLGEDTAEDASAKVTLVLDNLDITCEVAPAIVFRRVYECDGDWSAEAASATIDTSDAGAVVVIADGSVNNVTGSHVARIYKDNEEQKKLWKIDGAFYSFMSMNIEGEQDGTGVLNITADNEGLDSELHLTLNGGNVSIASQDDGINTNEDGVSVTTINGGTLHIVAGLGDEGDGIDSNGFLVINGGTVISMANPRSDSGLDSNMGSYINGGTVVALGSTMDWAESDSDQVTMNLQFASSQDAGDAIVVCNESGDIVFAYDPSEDETASGKTRSYLGAILSCPNFEVDRTYSVYVGGVVSGQETQGVYDVDTVTGYEGGTQQAYTGTDVQGGPGGGMGPGGQGGPGGMGPGGQGDQGAPNGGMGLGGQAGPGGAAAPSAEGETSSGMMPNGEDPTNESTSSQGNGQEPPAMPNGDQSQDSQNGQPPAGTPGNEQGSELPADGNGEPPAGPDNRQNGQLAGDAAQANQSGPATSQASQPSDSNPQSGSASNIQASTEFYMQDKVNAFSGVMAAAQ